MLITRASFCTRLSSRSPCLIVAWYWAFFESGRVLHTIPPTLSMVQRNLDEHQQDQLLHVIQENEYVLCKPDWEGTDDEQRQVSRATTSVALALPCHLYNHPPPLSQALDTPLWLAEVHSTSDPQTVDVAWCASFVKSGPKPRLDGKWSLLCKCTPFHKLGANCKGGRHGRWVDTVSDHAHAHAHTA